MAVIRKPAIQPEDPFARYQKASNVIKPRLIARIAGEVGSGKTSWALQAPGPVGVQTLDQGLEGVVEWYAGSKDIYVASYDMGITTGQEFTHELAVAARDKFFADFEHMITCMRTIIWDRESDLWDLHVFAETGTDDKFGAAKPKEWPKIKGKVRRLISMAKASDCNFLIIQGMRNEWGKSINPRTGAETATPTGNRIPSGMEEIEADVNVNLILERVDSLNDEEATFRMKVGKSRGPGARDVQGKLFDPSLSFKELAMAIYPDSQEIDWE